MLTPTRLHTFTRLLACLFLFIPAQLFAQEATVLTLWPDQPPGPPALVDGPEVDRQKPTDRLVGGKTVMKLGNVSTPEVHVYRPAPEHANGAACVICPGGGFSILAWDLEGTEVAEWLNSIGVTAVVLKYRVPTRQHAERWRGPVIDAQRAISLTRQHATAWNLDPQRIGLLGFSAGGETAALSACLGNQRLYETIDKTDESSCAANFALLIYPGGIVAPDGKLQPNFVITPATPPMFFVHAADDRVPCQASLLLFDALNRQKIPAELHIYHNGGHGYGLRPDTARVTRWPADALAWLKELGFLTAAPQ